MNAKEFGLIVDRLDVITKMLALQLLPGQKVAHRIRLLREAGLSYGQIGRVVGKTPEYVSATVLKHRKGRKKRKEA